MRFVWAIVGMVLGAVPTWWALAPGDAARRPVPAPAVPPAVIAGVTVPGAGARCPDRRPALEAARDALREELEALRTADRLREAERIEREGRPVPWPDDPGDLAPAVIEAAFREAAAATPNMEALGVDCEEYPCILAFARTDVLAERGTGLTRFEALTEALEGRGYGEDRFLGAVTGAVTDDAGARHFGVIAFGEGRDEPANTRTRTMFRLKKALEVARGQIEEPQP